jgi:hypothetical protein
VTGYTGQTGSTGNTGPTGTFATDYRGAITCNGLTCYNTGNFGNLTVNNEIVMSGNIASTSLWAGVKSTSRAYGVNQDMIALSCNGNATYQHLGTWTAPINGHFININYLHAQYFNINNSVSRFGTVAANGPTLIDLTIIFNTSNAPPNNDYIQPQGNLKYFGYGYGISTHCTAMPYSVWVNSTNTQLNVTSQTFDFYVQTGPYVGCAMISEMTNDTWTPETGSGNNGGIVSLPTTAMRLPLASNGHSMNQVYLTR